MSFSYYDLMEVVEDGDNVDSSLGIKGIAPTAYGIASPAYSITSTD